MNDIDMYQRALHKQPPGLHAGCMYLLGYDPNAASEKKTIKMSDPLRGDPTFRAYAELREMAEKAPTFEADEALLLDWYLWGQDKLKVLGLEMPAEFTSVMEKTNGEIPDLYGFYKANGSRVSEQEDKIKRLEEEPSRAWILSDARIFDFVMQHSFGFDPGTNGHGAGKRLETAIRTSDLDYDGPEGSQTLASHIMANHKIAVREDD